MKKFPMEVAHASTVSPSNLHAITQHFSLSPPLQPLRMCHHEAAMHSGQQELLSRCIGIGIGFAWQVKGIQHSGALL